LKTNGVELTDGEYRQVIMWFSRKSLQNDFDFSSVSTQRMEIAKPSKVLNLLKNAHGVIANITTKGDYSEISIVVRNNFGKTLFEVPITQSYTVLQSGVLNLDGQKPFRIIGGPWYNRTGKTRLSIRELKARFP
jgi:hypothetical protein